MTAYLNIYIIMYIIFMYRFINGRATILVGKSPYELNVIGQSAVGQSASEHKVVCPLNNTLNLTVLDHGFHISPLFHNTTVAIKIQSTKNFPHNH